MTYPNKSSSGHDFSAISPTARSLLLLKGHSQIPFARDAAALISRPEGYDASLEGLDPEYLKRLIHFEIRYWSIDQLLAGQPHRNILELSSGYSFRGLEAVRQHDWVFVDTDLPDVVQIKREMLEEWQQAMPKLKGEYFLEPLNVFDEKQMQHVLGHFSAGPVTIVNEGLLMYLDDQEKAKLCKIIHAVLKERGGCWITGDVYVNLNVPIPHRSDNDPLKKITDQFRIYEKMFASFEAARAFFHEQGFTVEQEAELDISRLSALPHLLKHVSPDQLKASPKFQATWRLRCR